MALDSRSLRYFVEIVRLGSISRAADHLGVSQPALSKTIKLLEEQFRVELLTRSPVGVTLTNAGQVLYRRAESIGAEIARAESEVLDVAKASFGSVCIGVLPSQMWELMPNVCKRLLEARKGIQLRIIEQSRSNLLEGLLRGEFDLAVSAVRQGESPKNVSCEPLFFDSHSLITRRNHPVARSFRDLCSYPWIVPPFTSKRGTELEQIFDSVGIIKEKDSITFIECHSNIFLKSMVRESDCIGLMPYKPSQIELENGSLSLLPFSVRSSPRTVCLLVRNDHPLSNAACSVAQTICAVAKENSNATSR